MMKTLFCLVALATISFALDQEFTAQFVGRCTVDQTNTFQCSSKASSQADQFNVNAEDAVIFDVTNLLGSYAAVQSTGKIDGETFTASGNITFGTHQARDHMIFFESLPGSGYTHSYESGEVVYSYSAKITGGSGAFNGAYGAMSVTGHAPTDYSETIDYISVVTNVELEN